MNNECPHCKESIEHYVEVDIVYKGFIQGYGNVKLPLNATCWDDDIENDIRYGHTKEINAKACPKCGYVMLFIK